MLIDLPGVPGVPSAPFGPVKPIVPSLPLITTDVPSFPVAPIDPSLPLITTEAPSLPVTVTLPSEPGFADPSAFLPSLEPISTVDSLPSLLLTVTFSVVKDLDVKSLFNFTVTVVLPVVGSCSIDVNTLLPS